MRIKKQSRFMYSLDILSLPMIRSNVFAVIHSAWSVTVLARPIVDPVVTTSGGREKWESTRMGIVKSRIYRPNTLRS